MKGITFEQLLGRVAQHRSNMKYAYVNPPFATLAEEIEDWICQRMDPKTQMAKCDTGVRHRASVHWNDIKDFLIANAKWMLQGKQPVPQGEAERRAEICSRCPLNVRMHGCGICMETLKGYREQVIARTTSYDTNLQACGVCGCDLKSIVHLPLSALEVRQGVNFPKWCWRAEQNASLPAAPQSSEQTPSTH